jgi:hypothetical protein
MAPDHDSLPPASARGSESRGTHSRPSTGRVPPPRVSEIASQLLLPGLLRAGGAAARPDRVLVALITLVAILATAISLSGGPTETNGLAIAASQIELGTDGFVTSLLRADLQGLSDRLRMLLLEAPETAIRAEPLRTAGLLAVFVVCWGLGGLYICRGAGMELGRRIRVKPGRLFTFLKVKAPAAILALLLPPAVIALLLLVPLALGAMMHVPVLDIVAGLLYVIGLAASVVAAFLLIAWLVAGWMLIPAVACDGADAFDATQRAFGMLLSRPLGVLTHVAVAIGQGVVVIGFVWIVADLAIGLAESVAGATGDDARWIASGLAAGSSIDAGTGGGARTAAYLVTIWKAILVLLVAAYGVSYAHAASTAVYLNARKMVDGQEPSELWMPGDEAGVVRVGTARAETVRTDSRSPDPAAAAPAPGDGDPGSSEPRG